MNNKNTFTIKPFAGKIEFEEIDNLAGFDTTDIDINHDLMIAMEINEIDNCLETNDISYKKFFLSVKVNDEVALLMDKMNKDYGFIFEGTEEEEGYYLSIKKEFYDETVEAFKEVVEIIKQDKNIQSIYELNYGV